MQFLLLGYCLLVAGCAASESRGAVTSNRAGTLEKAIALADTHAAEARRVWAGTEADGTGGPSPDGNWMSFVDWSAMTLNVRNVKTGEIRVLAKPPVGTSQFPEYSRFSPDGARIAYRWFNGEGSELRVISAQGGDPKIVVARNPDVSWISPLGWTRDAQSILAGLGRADGTSQLALVNVSSGKVRVLVSHSWEESTSGSAAASPDGRFIATGERRGKDFSEQAIVVAALDGGRQTDVVTTPGINKVVDWSNDGRLFYTNEHDGAASVYAVPMRDGRPSGAPLLLKSDFARALPMGLTSDGRLFYGELTGTWDVYVASFEPTTGRVVSSPTRATHRLIGFNQGIDWTNDGRQVAYLLRKGSVPRSPAVLAIRDDKTGEVREVDPALPYINAAIRWSPDGRSIVAQGSDKKGHTGLHLIDPRTGQFQTVFFVNPRGGMVHRPMWSPDGSALYYSLWDVDKGKAFRVMRRDLKSGVETEVCNCTGGTALYALSADGRNLAVIDNLNSMMTLSVVPVSGGKARALVTVPAKEGFSTVEFTRDGRRILYGRIRDAKTQATDLWSVPVSGGEPQLTGLSMKSLRGLRVHPDGRRLGFTGGELSQEIWVLENAGSPQVGATSAARR